ncbi:hypothetical protein EXIGLDRAFT_722968 [Exidia glandulosa HHB12029]|uniref:Uncharacterized protein n=1 Tax=Exidia glandulosa HHB12029 TaxID=1314781 RepID=A0A165F0T7_EXIGL|nr:hypothetical protein EXIGLDRAFT_722968 [Exidia glandulosa HHB12029]
MSTTTTSTPCFVSMTDATLPPLHTLNLLPERIVPPCIPQLIAPKLLVDDSSHRAPFQHVPRNRSNSSSSSSSSAASDSYPSTPSLSSPTTSRSSSPRFRSRSPSVRLVPSAAEEANALLWIPDGNNARTSAVLLTGAAVSKHLRSLERERGRAHPYRVVFNRRMSTTLDANDIATLPLRRLRASSEESN